MDEFWEEYFKLHPEIPRPVLVNADLPNASEVLADFKTSLKSRKTKIFLYSTDNAKYLDEKVLGVKVIDMRSVSQKELKELFDAE